MTRMEGTGMSAAAGATSSAARPGAAAGAGFRVAFQDARARGGSALAGGASGSRQATPSETEREFMEYAGLSLQEKLLRSALAALGISKKQFDAMSAVQKQEVMKKVSLLMEQLTRAEMDSRKRG